MDWSGERREIGSHPEIESKLDILDADREILIPRMLWESYTKEDKEALLQLSEWTKAPIALNDSEYTETRKRERENH